eukprot:678399_1
MFKITFISALFLHIIHAHFVYQSSPHSFPQSYVSADTAKAFIQLDLTHNLNIIEINTAPTPSSLRPFKTQHYFQGQSHRDCSSMSNRFTFKIHLDPFAGATASPEHVVVLMNGFHSATASSPGWVHACIVFSISVSSD